MTREAKVEKIIELTANRFYKDFAATTAAKVIELDAVGELYFLATNIGLDDFSPKQKSNIVWRSAYTLEYIYFNNRDIFAPYIKQFIRDFTKCDNPSAMRSFTKIMADILKYHKPTFEQMDNIAQCVANWVADPKVKVAVKVWSMSILRSLRPHILWLDDIWEDMEAFLINNSSPAIEVRFRRGWK